MFSDGPEFLLLLEGYAMVGTDGDARSRRGELKGNGNPRPEHERAPESGFCSFEGRQIRPWLRMMGSSVTPESPLISITLSAA